MYSQFDWFAEGDELESDLTGQKLYTLGAINEGARWASLGLQMALDIGGSLLGVDVFRSVALASPRRSLRRANSPASWPRLSRRRNTSTA